MLSQHNSDKMSKKGCAVMAVLLCVSFLMRAQQGIETLFVERPKVG